MALTRNMAYDNAAYVAVIPIILGGGTGATTTTKFTAWTTMVLRSVQITPFVAGTSTNASFNLVKVTSTQGTATDTTVLSTTTTLLATFTNNQQAAKNVYTGTHTVVGTLVAGDIIWLAQSTDATIQFAASAELCISPNANLSPPT